MCTFFVSFFFWLRIGYFNFELLNGNEKWKENGKHIYFYSPLLMPLLPSTNLVCKVILFLFFHSLFRMYKRIFCHTKAFLHCSDLFHVVFSSFTLHNIEMKQFDLKRKMENSEKILQWKKQIWFNWKSDTLHITKDISSKSHLNNVHILQESDDGNERATTTTTTPWKSVYFYLFLLCIKDVILVESL